MRDLRLHGELREPELQITGLVEGVCVSVDEATSTVVFTIPTYSPDYKYGPAPFVGGTMRAPLVATAVDTGPAGSGIESGYAHNAPTVGSRLLVAFASNGRPWVLGWTTQP